MAHTAQNLWTVCKIINRNIILKQNMWVPVQFLCCLPVKLSFNNFLVLKKKFFNLPKEKHKKKKNQNLAFSMQTMQMMFRFISFS